MAEIFEKIKQDLAARGLDIVSEDLERPWGGFLVLDEGQIEQFRNEFFPNLVLAPPADRLKMSPKILLVAPGKRLSWQYHDRRGELWCVVQGPVGIFTSLTNDEGELKTLATGQEVKMQVGERHRLVGLDNWGVVAEIWEHSDPASPSNEDDIVRVKDDFGR
jgi:mannose-6-phosphate isomerase